MKLLHRTSQEPSSQIEPILTEMFGKGPTLSAQGRQRIWHHAQRLAHMPLAPQRYPVRLIFYPTFVILLVIGMVSGYTGVVFASGTSVPGEPLYPIVRQSEAVWLSLTPESRRCQVQLWLLERRVYEAKALLDAGKTVPDDILQETELLFLAVADDTTCQPIQTGAALPYLISYRAKLAILSNRHPGIEQLDTLLEAANNAVIQLGGAPLELVPPDAMHLYQRS